MRFLDHFSNPRDEALPLTAQQRLIRVRAALLLGEWLGVVLLWVGLDARLPLFALALVLALHATLNVIAWLRMRLSQGSASTLEFTLQLSVDAACLGALVYFTGGYANPFISLLLVPLIVAAVTLPPWHAWAMALWVAAIYSFLMRFYQPLAIQVSPEVAVDMHLSGMWLNFLLTAALVAAFVGRQAATLRKRDAALAQEREQRLRDEQLFALGLQAATAAHDLATPMNALRITIDELQQDYAGDEELTPPLALLAGQVQRMQSVLARLGEAARLRSSRHDGVALLSVDIWIKRTLERWGLMWPQVKVNFTLQENLPPLVDDSALEAVLIVLLNNAAQADATTITLQAYQTENDFCLNIIDDGNGLKHPVENIGNNNRVGWGIGLDLARAALQRMGGQLNLSRPESGGVCACILLPRTVGYEQR